MGKDKAPKPPTAGIIYGEITYWLLIVGTIVAIVGIAIYMMSGGYVNQTCLLNHLWGGADVSTIWKECAGAVKLPEGHWYLGMLSQGDGIAMLGIAISCLAAVFGIWGAFIGLLRSRERVYIILALMIAVILTLSALGVITLKH